jgi:hypothetical protein
MIGDTRFHRRGTAQVLMRPAPDLGTMEKTKIFNRKT